MPRYFLKLAYNGTSFHGWQIQENAHSIQEEIQKSLGILLKKETTCIGCGRTDTGVHARCFYAHFDSAEVIESKKNFIYQLNALLDKSIAIHDLFLVKNDAHARFDAISRTYQYHIHLKRDPFLELKSYHRRDPLHLGQIEQCFPLLLGTKDFSCFSKSRTQVKTNICDITALNMNKNDNDEYLFTITANRFLRGMVRAIVGTLLNISSGKKSIHDLQNMIDSKNRMLAGESVPPYALYLTDIIYPNEIFID